MLLLRVDPPDASGKPSKEHNKKTVVRTTNGNSQNSDMVSMARFLTLFPHNPEQKQQATQEKNPLMQRTPLMYN
jgi:hypothetical protein